jgi:hypothetical protein
METDIEGLSTEELRDLFFNMLEKYSDLHQKILEIKSEVESRGETL